MYGIVTVAFEPRTPDRFGCPIESFQIGSISFASFGNLDAHRYSMTSLPPRSNPDSMATDSAPNVQHGSSSTGSITW